MEYPTKFIKVEGNIHRVDLIDSIVLDYDENNIEISIGVFFYTVDFSKILQTNLNIFISENDRGYLFDLDDYTDFGDDECCGSEECISCSINKLGV